LELSSNLHEDSTSQTTVTAIQPAIISDWKGGVRCGGAYPWCHTINGDKQQLLRLHQAEEAVKGRENCQHHFLQIIADATMEHRTKKMVIDRSSGRCGGIKGSKN
jgi:hypothetical protein